MLAGYYRITKNLSTLTLCAFCHKAIVICGVTW